MITKMTKYTFILMSGRREKFLKEIQELGVVDITRSTKAVDEHSERLMFGIEDIRRHISQIKAGSDHHLDELMTKVDTLTMEEMDLLPWGDFDREKLESLGLDVHLGIIHTKEYRQVWAEDYPMEIVSEDALKCHVVIFGDVPDIPVELVPMPQKKLSEVQSELKVAKEDAERYQRILEGCRKDIPLLEKKEAEMTAELNLYLASRSAENAVESKIIIFQGFAPIEDNARLAEAFDSMDVIWIAEDAVKEDNPPIEFKNNRFVKLFEPLTDMYGRPSYDGFDPTPFLSIFFLLFFAMCMGDAGYGLILVIVGMLLKKVESFSRYSSLVSVLGGATVVVGILFHTFFSVDMSQWAFIPDFMKAMMVPAKIGAYDGTMVVALAVGVIHLLLAMIVKTIVATKNIGFLESLSTWGWTLLWTGLASLGLISLAGFWDKDVVRLSIIVLGVICAIGIFPLNNIHGNPLKNIGSGLWDTYNMATGILGDVLSYLRLYALGLAGSMLGLAFNQLAEMVLGDGGVKWIPFILIVITGHTLNLAMAALGAFVHPLRLNFLEFFKNSGYEATGRTYNPLKK